MATNQKFNESLKTENKQENNETCKYRISFTIHLDPNYLLSEHIFTPAGACVKLSFLQITIIYVSH